jgi:hypothetical protein
MANYLNKEEFYQAMLEFNKIYLNHKQKGLDKPGVSNYIGKCLLDIANGLSLRREFVGYSFREDMIMDGVENCLTYIHDFDPNIGKNPFAYFTQIIYFAFLRRIEKEKKQSYIKAKVQERHITFDEVMVDLVGEDKLDYGNNYDIIESFETAKKRKKEKREEAKQLKELDNNAEDSE